MLVPKSAQFLVAVFMPGYALSSPSDTSIHNFLSFNTFIFSVFHWHATRN